MQRRNVLGLALLLLTPSSAVFAQAGLAERRAIAAYRQDKWPPIEAAIRKAAGFEVPVDVEWDQLTIPGDAAHYADDEYYGKTIFQPLVAALNSITADQMGRDALKAKLQRIHVRFDEKTAPASNYPNGLSFAGGVLDINWRPYSNTADVEDRTKALTQILEKNL
ncbi:MAG: hypothetical protein EON47_20770 [Acetobacteraceae bacterium]|nr:MAG: hypothetical protein EON47_20770 [Acetobacteraceae bacterium]